MPGEKTRHTVYLGDFQSLFKIERREYAGHAPGKHGLTAAGRTNEKDIMRPGRCYLHSTLGTLLPLHVGEVEQKFLSVFRGRRHGGLKLGMPHEKRYGLAQSMRRKHRKPFYDSGFAGIVRSYKQAARLFVAGQKSKRKYAGNRLESSIQRKFCRREPAFESLGRYHTRRSQKPESEGQIVGRTFLPAVSRSKIHSDPGCRETHTAVFCGSSNPFSGFFDSGIR
jgi:hypothetical protein